MSFPTESKSTHKGPMKRRTLIVLLALAAILAYPMWKPFAKRNRWFVVATNLGLDSLRRYGLSSRQIGQSATPSLSDAKIQLEIRNANNIYQRYLRFAGWTSATVAGKRMIELGPGYTISIPLLFAANGAQHVVGIDKFVPLQTGNDFRKLYSVLRDGLSGEEKRRFDDVVRLSPRLAFDPHVLTYIDHQELPDCISQLGTGYDLIVSNAVIEEIYDPGPYFVAQDHLLRPGGVMVHVIDLRDYGMFSKYGFNPLEFLTVPDWVYARMVAASGQPNRRLVDYYRDIARGIGYQSEIYITRVLGRDAELPGPKLSLSSADVSAQGAALLHEIRPRLLDRYQRLSDADLLIQSIILVAHKPSEQ